MINHSISTTSSIVISGASSGIGKACAIYLDKLGYKVYAGVRKESDGVALREKTSNRLVPILLDVTKEESIKVATNIIKTSNTNLVGLVNNAGIAVAGPLELLPLTQLRKQIEVNVIGHIAVIQAFLPLLRNSQGRIINMSSDNGKVSVPFLGPYCASKFALEALTDALRSELAPWGIAVSLIEPGIVKTSIWDKSTVKADNIWDHLPHETKNLYGEVKKSLAHTAEKLSHQGCSPEVVAKTVSYALTTKHPKARYVVGWDAKLNILLSKILPERMFDSLLMTYLGLSNN